MLRSPEISHTIYYQCLEEKRSRESTALAVKAHKEDKIVLIIGLFLSGVRCKSARDRTVGRYVRAINAICQKRHRKYRTHKSGAHLVAEAVYRRINMSSKNMWRLPMPQLGGFQLSKWSAVR